MDATTNRTHAGAKLARVAGMAAIAGAIALNPVTLMPFSDGGLSNATVFLVLAFDSALLLLAVLLLLVPNSRGILAKLGLAVALPLLVAELLLRLFDPLGASYYFNVTRFAKRTQPDRAFAYSMKPGDDFRLAGVRYQANALGLRGPEVATPKPAGRWRVLLLGDSVVMGLGVPYDDTFAARLGPLLAKEGVDADVVAAGVSSWNTRVESAWMRAHGYALEPDVVVLVPLPNDVEAKLVPGTRLSKAQVEATQPPRAGLVQVAAGRSYLLTSILHVARKRSAARRTDALHDAKAPAWIDLRAAFHDLVTDCRDRGIPLLVAPYSPASDASAFRRAWTQAITEERVGRIDLPEAIFDPARRLSLIDAHPDEQGHALVAEALLPEITRVLAARAPAPAPPP